MIDLKMGFVPPLLFTNIIIIKMPPPILLRWFGRTDVECAS